MVIGIGVRYPAVWYRPSWNSTGAAVMHASELKPFRFLQDFIYGSNAGLFGKAAVTRLGFLALKYQ